MPRYESESRPRLHEITFGGTEHLYDLEDNLTFDTGRTPQEIDISFLNHYAGGPSAMHYAKESVEHQTGATKAQVQKGWMRLTKAGHIVPEGEYEHAS